MQKLPKPSYRQIRLWLKQRYPHYFSLLHDDSELKQMTSQEALRILTWFNEEAFGVPRDRLSDNFDPQWYRDNGLPVPEGAKQAIELINVNLIAYKGLSKVNQHLPFHFNMILNPEQFAPEWKQLLHQMLDFLEFKEVMLPKHQNEISKLAQKKRDVIETEKQLMLEHQKLD